MKTEKLKNITYMLKTKKAFTIAELLIALMVTGLLLAAVAVAFNASVKNYNTNEHIFKAVNKARQALTLITTQLRTAKAVETSSPSNECTFISDANEDITYQYNSSQNKLYMIKDSIPYLLGDNVTAMTFTKNTGGGGAYVESVQISITVTSGDIQKTFSSAVVIRKNLQ